jgi:hypothetical protein
MNIIHNAGFNLDVSIIALAVLSLVVFLSSIIIREFTNRKWYAVVYDHFLFVMGAIECCGFLYAMYPGYSLTWEIILYAPVLGILLAAFAAFMKKDLWYLLDALFLVFFLPCMMINEYMLIPLFVSLLYFFYKSAVSLVKASEDLRASINRYTIKDNLDNLDGGLIIADKKGHISFINKYFSSFLSSEGIDTLQKTDTLKAEMKKHARVIETNVFLFEEGEHFYLLRWLDSRNGSEGILSDVTEEERLSLQIDEANKKLLKEQEALRNTLDVLKEIEREKVKERMLGLVHDSFAEEVSFIHQIVINPASNNLVPLKNLVKKGLENPERGLMNLESLIKDYEMLGVEFKVYGSLEGLPKEEMALEVIAESIDNAIRHGNASLITIRIESALKEYSVSIENNGVIPESFSPHNGLSHLEKLVKVEDGRLQITTDPVFTVKAFFKLS